MDLTNFRDIGGIATRLGKIKEKRLLRSGQLFELSESDCASLRDDYHLRLIIDLRAPNECLKHPDTQVDGARYLNIDVMKGMVGGAPGFDMLLQQLDLSIVDEHMLEVYRDIILNKAASEEYGRFVNEVANLPDGAALFHCFAGKDRTGLCAVLMLETLGATKDDIMADYMLTNIMREEANTAICADSVKRYNLSADKAEALRQFLLVKEDYLHESYLTINETYGSVEKYMTEGLQVLPETLDKLRAKYLV